MSPYRCAICEQDFGPDQLHRMHGIDVCDGCRTAPGERVGSWASVAVSESWGNFKVGGDSSTHLQLVEVRGRGRVGLPKVSFGAESLGWLRRLFTHEVQVGDQLFDDTVWVSTSDREATARLLANDGVQSAVLEAVTMPASLDLDGSEARLRATSVNGHPPGECGVLVLAILRHAADMGCEGANT